VRTIHFRDPAVEPASNGWELPLLVSPLFEADFVHGFTTRAGGVSAPPFDTLNLGGKWGDDPARVVENRRRLAGAVPGRCYVARQVHGPAIVRVRAGEGAEAIARVEADGLVSDAVGVSLGVFVADCIPALIADPRTGAFASVHAGWRGTVAGVLPAAVRALATEFGARPGDLRIALGPAIGPCCFEVGEEVVATLLGIRSGSGYVMVRISNAGEKWSNCSPGRLIIERTMAALHRDGIRQFDFSIGNYAYKRRFGVAPLALADLTAALGWRGIPFAMRDRAAHELRRHPRLAGYVGRALGKPASREEV